MKRGNPRKGLIGRGNEKGSKANCSLGFFKKRKKKPDKKGKKQKAGGTLAQQFWDSA